jgi:hypothetical protein
LHFSQAPPDSVDLVVPISNFATQRLIFLQHAAHFRIGLAVHLGLQ